jgi:hypothetical protein
VTKKTTTMPIEPNNSSYLKTPDQALYMNTYYNG